MTVLRDRFNKDRSDLPNVVFNSGDSLAPLSQIGFRNRTRKMNCWHLRPKDLAFDRVDSAL